MEYRCDICNKNYKTYQTLWKHNKQFHKIPTPIVAQSYPKSTPNISDDILKNTLAKHSCTYCKKIYSSRQNKWKHQQKCKYKNELITIDKKQFDELQNKISKLELQIKKSNNKINNNIINNNNGTINNITNNNIVINEFGTEKICNFPVKELKKFIRNDNYLYNIIEYINFNKDYVENHSFCTTSLEGKYVSLLNPKTNIIEKISKDRFLESVYENANDKIEAILFEFDNNKDFREQFSEKYINYLKTKYGHSSNLFLKNKIYKKKYKTDINQLSYNKKKLIQDTWKKIDNLKTINENILEDNLSESSESTLATNNNSNCNSDYSESDSFDI